MSKPSPTGRLSGEREPIFHEFPKEGLPRGGEALTEFKEFSPGLWEKLERRLGAPQDFSHVVTFSGRTLGKSWFTKRLYEERLKVLAEERRLGQLAIKKAIAAFFASFKR